MTVEKIIQKLKDLKLEWQYTEDTGGNIGYPFRWSFKSLFAVHHESNDRTIHAELYGVSLYKWDNNKTEDKVSFGITINLRDRNSKKIPPSFQEVYEIKQPQGPLFALMSIPREYYKNEKLALITETVDIPKVGVVLLQKPVDAQKSPIVAFFNEVTINYTIAMSQKRIQYRKEEKDIESARETQHILEDKKKQKENAIIQKQTLTEILNS